MMVFYKPENNGSLTIVGTNNKSVIYSGNTYMDSASSSINLTNYNQIISLQFIHSNSSSWQLNAIGKLDNSSYISFKLNLQTNMFSLDCGTYDYSMVFYCHDDIQIYVHQNNYIFKNRRVTWDGVIFVLRPIIMIYDIITASNAAEKMLGFVITDDYKYCAALLYF